MPKFFNTEGFCSPEQHYMVNLDSRLAQTRKMIDAGKYFTINRGRQYGKTTTLKALERYLNTDYVVIRLDFQGNMSSQKFADENVFSAAFVNAVKRTLKRTKYFNDLKPELEEMEKFIEKSGDKFDLVTLFELLSDMCSDAPKPIVLMIDEVDQASNNQVFLDFLAQLRYYYLERDNLPTFQSVILAGVHDIRNLKQKIRPDSEHKHNSPLNIAADFDVDMNFSVQDITGMLNEYESDFHTGMDTTEMSQLIYDYTSGYPVLVSALCKMIDEKNLSWTKQGFSEALKLIYLKKMPLFESLINKLEDNKDLRTMIEQILFEGSKFSYNSDDAVISALAMYGFIRNDNGTAAIANRIFETRIYNWLLSVYKTSSELSQAGIAEKSQFIDGNNLNMERILLKFSEHYTELYGDKPEKFKEDDGRKLFLLYLRPIINGTGNYYVEARTRNNRRTDVIIDYLGKQYIVELKIWHGERYNADGEQQISEYLDYYHLDKGYMLSFSFNKNKSVGLHTEQINGKTLIEIIV